MPAANPPRLRQRHGAAKITIARKIVPGNTGKMDQNLSNSGSFALQILQEPLVPLTIRLR